MNKLSIGLRLTLSYLFIFTIGQLLFGLGMWITLRQNLYDIADDVLEGQVEDVQHFLEAQRQNASVAKLQEEITETFVLEHSGDYLQIRDEQGDWIYRAAFLEKNSTPVPIRHDLQKPVYEDRKIAGRPFRFLTAIIDVRGRRFIVQTGLLEDDILLTLNAFRRNLFLSALLILVLASGMGFWLSRKALAPVDAITKTAKNISAANLGSRLERLHTGDELERLSDTLNEMLSRIEGAFQRISRFTADASHELRTPISLMRTEAEIALRRSRDEGEYRDALRHILVEAERTTALIEELLSLARADAGRESLDIRSLDLQDAVRRATRDWGNVASAHHLTLTARLADHDLRIAGDRASLDRLFNILLDNAVKYTPPKGSIEIGLEASDRNAVLTVKDNGIGISEQDQPRIFERFYRADKARSRELGGAGLGLAIAQWIVEQHKGSITVTSSPGEGTQFMIVLPLELETPTKADY